MLKQIKRYTLVILLCIFLSPSEFSQSGKSMEKGNNAVPLVNAPTIRNQSQSNLAGIAFLLVQEEPVLLLLCGLTLFAGATTLRRKQSQYHRQPAPEGVGSSV